jgi:hypothetical protein
VTHDATGLLASGEGQTQRLKRPFVRFHHEIEIGASIPVIVEVS